MTKVDGAWKFEGQLYKTDSFAQQKLRRICIKKVGKQVVYEIMVNFEWN